jgi:hypothetical protein
MRTPSQSSAQRRMDASRPITQIFLILPCRCSRCRASLH